MKKHLFTILIGAASMVVSQPVRAQGIVATHDAYGHTVWVAADEAKLQAQAPQPAATSSSSQPAFSQAASQQASLQPAAAPVSEAASQETSHYSGLVYWSNKQH